MAGKLLILGGGETQKVTNSFESPLLSEIFKNSDIKNIEIIMPPSDKQ